MTSVGQDMEKRESSCFIARNVNWCSYCEKQYGGSSKNQKDNYHNPAILLYDMYMKKMKAQVRKDACTPMFFAVLSIIAKIWKQPKCPSLDEWVKKMQYVYIYGNTYILWNITQP